MGRFCWLRGLLGENGVPARLLLLAATVVGKELAIDYRYEDFWEGTDSAAGTCFRILRTT